MFYKRVQMEILQFDNSFENTFIMRSEMNNQANTKMKESLKNALSCPKIIAIMKDELCFTHH
ncbi:unnamed protein product [Moneuplotes crassus]|uniref:Uncharacterized protein n=1 Tax=Euplotes crassus TaxID=5936 RepID=A0AAD1U8X5_EUPCR|nr:unnamed protein product [Moneuplotes crassus]